MKHLTDFQLMILEKEKIDCLDVVGLLNDFEEQELPPTLRGRLDAHISGCACCEEMRAGYRLVMDLAKELPEKPLPSGVDRRLRAALNKRLGLDLALGE